MMALQMLVLLGLVLFLQSPASAYPVYGTKRYGRSTVSWPPYQMVRTQRYPINYYELYPYSQYPEEYYPQETYPVYYPRTSKYEVYQAVLPYYYGDRFLTRPNYGYYDSDPTVDLQEEMMQEAEREEREESQPIGHELLYENEPEENLDEVNAAFLQNLIMSQMYKEALDQKDYYDEYYPEEYGKWEDPKPKARHQEDEDVRELKQLVKSKPKPKPKMDEVHWFQRSSFRNQEEKRQKNERKVVVKATTPAPKGQKEEVLMRPATPVRHPFSSPVLDMMAKDEKRAPSVYDTIKHMLDMEKSLENEVRPHMKKRIVSSEESLTHQLSVLKKQ